MLDGPFAALQNPASLKMIICVRRRPTMSLPQFLHYWLANHAPLALSAYERGHAPPMLGYIQNHTLPQTAIEQCTAATGMLQRSYDGLTEVWLNKIEDLDMSAQVCEALVATNNILIADEASFVDLSDSRVFAVECQSGWKKSKLPNTVVKLVLLLQRESESSAASQQMQRHNESQALIQWVESNANVCGFTQSRTVDSRLMDSFRVMRGMHNHCFDDMLEVWCDASSIDKNLASICEQLVALYANSDVDFGDSCLYLTQPYRIF